jgi:hypothetical protein
MQTVNRVFSQIALVVLFLALSSHGFSEQRTLKILHLTFHRGCAIEIDAAAKVFGHEVTTWFIPELAPKTFDGTSSGNALYNIGHERAERIWNLHHETFEEFDLIITSDTAALSRIFLQNGFTKPLIIWICNRIDYKDQASLDCNFPDPEFYELFNEAHLKDNVTLIAYTPFEHVYAKKVGIETGNLLITPCAPGPVASFFFSSIPHSVIKKETFFLPPYANETIFMNLAEHCKNLGISAYSGRYNGPNDLREFKGIIHLPYAWSNLAFFENIALGVPYFIPSPSFLKTLLQQEGYWHANPAWLIEEERFDLSEWYQPNRAEIITYFDSWDDLKDKIATVDYAALREKTKKYAQEYRCVMLDRWSQIFKEIH